MVGSLEDDQREVIVSCLVNIAIVQIIKTKNLRIKLFEYLRPLFSCQTRVRFHALKEVALDIRYVKQIRDFAEKLLS